MNQKHNFRLVLCIALLAGFSGFAGAAYDDLGVSARVMGMGNAFTAVADDAYSVYYNPAGLALLPRPEFGTAYAKLYPGLSDNSNLQNTFLVYAMPLDQGKQGGLGFGLDYFSLDSLYHETSLYASYGRDLLPGLLPDKLYGGLSLKYLNRGVNPGSLANAPVSDTGQILQGEVDPVLQNTSKTNIDMDLGLLYKLDPRWTLGLTVQHLLEPNIAFGSTPDPLDRNYKLGASYRTPFALLSGEIDDMTAPDYSREEIATFAAEKWLPTLQFGTFGIRGALSAGTQQYRALSVGLSYKIYKMEFDYGMTVPFGGIADMYGTQRIGLTFFFGHSRTPEPAFSEALLEDMGQLAEVGTPEFKAQMEDLARYQREAMESFLSRARVLSGQGRFADAYSEVQQAISISSTDATLQESAKRLMAVAAIYPEVENFSSDPVQVAVYEGILDFLSGENAAALKSLDYAHSISPSDDRIAYLRSIISGMFPGKAVPSAAVAPKAPASAVAPIAVSTAAAPPVTASAVSARAQSPAQSVAKSSAPASNQAAAQASAAGSEIAADTALMEVALSRQEYGKVVKLGRQIVQIDATDESAYLRMGVAYYALKRYSEALESLRIASRLARDEKTRKELDSYIGQIEDIEQKASEAKAAASPEDIESLYNAGVEFYAQGRLKESARMFQRILQMDPQNESAAKALKRVNAEIMESGESGGAQ